MQNVSFYQNPEYKFKQSLITKENWARGIYDFRRKSIEKICTRPDCGKKFYVATKNPKKYCSQSCAAIVNNEKRPNGKKINKNILLSLYNSGSSMAEISKKLNHSIHKVSYWMDKHKIRKRTLSEAIYLKQNPNGDPFKIKTKLSHDDNALKNLGLGLYWGEGEKTSNGGIRLGNTDPGILRQFRQFLIKIYDVNPARLHYSLVVFNDSNPALAIKYWSKELSAKEDKFGKPTIIPPQGRGTYKQKSQFGVATLSFNNIKLKSEILKMIAKLRSCS